MINKVFCIIFPLIVLVGCSSNYKIPVWEIKKSNQPISYLMYSTDCLTQSDVDVMLTNNIINWFDSCEALITFWDTEKSSMLESKKWIEIGNDKSLKDTLSKEDYIYFKKRIEDLLIRNGIKNENLNEIYIKPHFYVNDILNKTRKENNFNIDYFWLRRGMAQQKDFVGLETYQDYYRFFNKTKFNETIRKLNNFDTISILQKKLNDLYKKEEFNEILKNKKDLMSFTFLNHQKLLTERNSKWSLIIDSVLKQNKTFIALDIDFVNKEDNNSLYHKLTSLGYEIKRIN